MSAATTISREHRDAVRSTVLLDLAGASGDIELMLKCEKFAEARGFRERAEDDMRLLDDLGWEEANPRTAFELTMPREQLERIFRRLDIAARACLREYAENLQRGPDPVETPDLWEDYARVADEDLDVCSASRAVFGQLGVA